MRAGDPGAGATGVTGAAGVTEVLVDLGPGLAHVISDAPLAEADVRAAVDEAGYELGTTP